MAVKVKIPNVLRRLAGGRAEMELEGRTVREVIMNLESAAPGFRGRLLDGGGEVRRFIAVFVNGEDIHKKSGAATPVSDGDEVELVPAAAGG